MTSIRLFDFGYQVWKPGSLGIRFGLMVFCDHWTTFRAVPQAYISSGACPSSPASQLETQMETKNLGLSCFLSIERTFRALAPAYLPVPERVAVHDTRGRCRARRRVLLHTHPAVHALHVSAGVCKQRHIKTLHRQTDRHTHLNAETLHVFIYTGLQTEAQQKVTPKHTFFIPFKKNHWGLN